MTVQGFALNIAQFCHGAPKRGGGGGRGQEVQRMGERAKLAAGLLFFIGFLFLFSRHLAYRQGLGKLEPGRAKNWASHPPKNVSVWGNPSIPGFKSSEALNPQLHMQLPSVFFR